jgi:hypothetical protein
MTAESVKVAWREWYNAPAVVELEAMGTLPQCEIDPSWDDGASVARAIAEHANEENLLDGGHVVILEPEDYTGTYRIDVDWEPQFSACQEDLG